MYNFLPINRLYMAAPSLTGVFTLFYLIGRLGVCSIDAREAPGDATMSGQERGMPPGMAEVSDADHPATVARLVVRPASIIHGCSLSSIQPRRLSSAKNSSA